MLHTKQAPLMDTAVGVAGDTHDIHDARIMPNYFSQTTRHIAHRSDGYSSSSHCNR